FPKSGSYLVGGRNLKSEDISEMVELAQSITEERRQKLNSLKASTEFMELEEMRLKLDQLNTILSMPVYGSFKGYWDYTEAKKVEVLSGAKDVLNEVSEGLMKDEYMKHPNFRDMLHGLVNADLKAVGIFADLKFTPFMSEYDEMGAFVTQLELNGLSNEMQQQADEFLTANHSAEYKGMVQQKLEEYAALLPGEPAFDVLFKDALGGEKPLSEFAGQLTYVDLWATWCGPCIAELPAFEQLKEDYKDKPINFVPVSIDTDLEAWQKYLETHDLPKDHEYVINRLDLSDYKVITIPRYLLIDSEFKIISVFAPVPSDPETRRLLDKYLTETTE
ncbi:MAG: TlpA family protein disulfide reductase, partial [Cytophagia bacterium]|nr:TlpA family protein disulfide reductase [Cytophagia bacterium]